MKAQNAHSAAAVLISEAPPFGLMYHVEGAGAWDFLQFSALPDSTLKEWRCSLSRFDSCDSPVLTTSPSCKLSVIEVAFTLSRCSGAEDSLQHRVAFKSEQEWHRFEASLKDEGCSLLLSAYECLYSRGWRLRHGARFGAHFLGYNVNNATDDSHTHADVLIWVDGACNHGEATLPPQELTALRRVAKSTNKSFLVVEWCSCDDGFVFKIIS